MCFRILLIFLLELSFKSIDAFEGNCHLSKPQDFHYRIRMVYLSTQVSQASSCRFYLLSCHCFINEIGSHIPAEASKFRKTLSIFYGAARKTL